MQDRVEKFLDGEKVLGFEWIVDSEKRVSLYWDGSDNDIEEEKDFFLSVIREKPRCYKELLLLGRNNKRFDYLKNKNFMYTYIDSRASNVSVPFKVMIKDISNYLKDFASDDVLDLIDDDASYKAIMGSFLLNTYLEPLFKDGNGLKFREKLENRILKEFYEGSKCVGRGFIKKGFMKHEDQEVRTRATFYNNSFELISFFRNKNVKNEKEYFDVLDDYIKSTLSMEDYIKKNNYNSDGFKGIIKLCTVVNPSYIEKLDKRVVVVEEVVEDNTCSLVINKLLDKEISFKELASDKIKYDFSFDDLVNKLKSNDDRESVSKLRELLVEDIESNKLEVLDLLNLFCNKSSYKAKWFNGPVRDLSRFIMASINASNSEERILALEEKKKLLVGYNKPFEKCYAGNCETTISDNGNIISVKKEDILESYEELDERREYISFGSVVAKARLNVINKSFDNKIEIEIPKVNVKSE